MPYLPGQTVVVSNDEWGTQCHTHGDVKAVHRIVGETDSFGSEFINMCQPCYDEYLAAKEAVANDESQWETCKCGARVPELTAWRDPEEGSSGPLYYTCSPCRQKVMDAFCDGDDDDYDDYDDCDYDNYDPGPHHERLELTTEHKRIIIEELKKVTGCDFVYVDYNNFRVDGLDHRKVQKVNKKLFKWSEEQRDEPSTDMADKLSCDYLSISNRLKWTETKPSTGIIITSITRYDVYH